MANFCTNCGFKLGRDDNFCTKCGTKVDKSDMRQNNSSSNQIWRIRSHVLGSVLGGFKFGFATFWLCNSRQIA